MDGSEAQRYEIPVSIIESFRLDGQVALSIGAGLVSERAS